jgi:hypothetical protein
VAAHAAYRTMRLNVRFALLTVPMDGHDVIEPAIVGTDPAMWPFVARVLGGVPRIHGHSG